MKIFLCSLLLCGAFAAKETSSPVAKVIELLDDLRGKVEGDLAAEKAAMGEYTSWCDTEQGDKTFAIKSANSKINDVNAVVEDTTAQIESLESDIAKFGSDIAEKEQELADAGSVRKDDRANFEETEKEVLHTIDELTRGTMAVKKETSFAQVKGLSSTPSLRKSAKVAKAMAAIVEAAWVDAAGKRRLTKFMQSAEQEDDDLTLKQPQGSVTKYGSHSGGILSTLTDMTEKAEATLSDTRKAEMKSAHQYAMLKAGLGDEIRLLNKRLSDATQEKAAAGEAKAKAEGEIAATQKAKAADEEYLRTVTMNCKAKAEEWAARQKDAEGELGAIAKAKEILSSGVKAFMQVAAVRAKVPEDEDLEMANRRARLQQTLKAMGAKFHSFRLVQMASLAASDPFGKVRGLIEDMVANLEREAQEEASQKAFCDEELSKSNAAKEEKLAKIDKFQARIDGAATSKATLQQDIKTLEAEVAEIDRTQAEAAKIRGEENAEYQKASSDYKQSSEAVLSAITVLKQYYEGGSFLQLSTKAGQPSFGSARSDGANSIIGILEVAESDFDKLLMETETQEGEAAKAFETLSNENAVSKTAKVAEVKGKQSEIKSLQVSLTHYTEDKGTSSEELDAVYAYLDKLKPECESKVMSYEERKARREAEIDGLREALSILEGTGIAALVQTRSHNLRH